MYKLYLKENIDSKEFLSNILNSINITNFEIVYNEYNKPYLKNNEIYFSISHSKNLVAIVISDKEVGIDLEYLTYKKNALNKAYTDSEKNLVGNDKFMFTKIWVMKEAYVKMLGKGLSYGLKNVDTIKLENRFNVINGDDYLIAIIESE